VHWARIIRNIFSNWTSYLVTMAVGFLLAPFIVHSLGDTGYGLWTLVLSITGYFGLLDLGIRSSVGRYVTRYLALHDQSAVNRTASTAFAILACGGIVALVTTVALVALFFDAFKIDPQYAVAGRTALLVTGLNVALILPLGVFSSVLIALERYDVVSGVTITVELARAALVVWLLRHGYGLVGLALLTLAITVVQYSLMGFLAKALYRPLQLRVSLVESSAGRELFGFSIYRFIWIIANQLIFYSDALVIGFFLGTAAITPYAIAGSLINYGRNVVSLVTDTLYPAAARMDAENDRDGLQRLLITATRLALLVTLPLCLGLLFLGRQFITLWLGPAYAESAVILAVLTIPQFGSMSQYGSALVLTGMARHSALAYFALGEGIANLVLSIFLVRKMGVIGVAWGTVIPHLLCTSVVLPLYTLRVLRVGVSDYFVQAYVRPLICAIPTGLLGYALFRLGSGSWFFFAVEAFAMSAVFGIVSYFVCLDRAQRALVTYRLAAVLQREAVVQ